MEGDRSPRLVSPWFGDNPQFVRMARVLEFTARRHCPGWSVEVEKIVPSIERKSPLGILSHSANTQKMDAWAAVIAAAPDGDRILLIDSDTMVLRPLDDVWDADFDMAYTTKPGRFPFNSGVVFLRVGEAARAFAAAWQRENARLLDTPQEHLKWRGLFGGMNQAALGAMLTGGIVERLGLRVVKIPCVEWNLEDSSWISFDPARCRIVHLKSGLRRAVFSPGLRDARYVRLVRIWQALEREAGGGPRPPAAPVYHPVRSSPVRPWRRIPARAR